MQKFFSDLSVSVCELKKSPSSILARAADSPIVILNRNQPVAYLVSADAFEDLMELLEDCQLGKLVEVRRNERLEAIKISLNEL